VSDPVDSLRSSVETNRPKSRSVTRFAYRLRRTLRYLLNLLVWSRVTAARKGIASLEISQSQYEHKGIAHAQPTLKIEGRSGAEHVQTCFLAVNDILFANLRTADLITPLRHAEPGPAFAGVYLWDSAFIAQIWKLWDVPTAQEVLESVVALREGDRLQHVVADFVHSAYTQPPLVAWSAMQLPQCPQTQPWLRRIYQPLCRYHAWLNQHRRLPCGLYFWQHPYESGVENAPRFSSRDEKTLADTRPLAAPDLSCQVILQCEALAKMAEALGEARASEFRDTASQIRKQMNTILWHEEDGLYYDKDTRNHQWIRSKTIASLMPLAAGAPDQQRAARLHEHCTDASSFGSTLPLPSVALDDPDFARDMWRGPVWVNTAYLVLQGLKRYGFSDTVSTLSWRLVDGVARVLEAENHIYEFYDPEHFHTKQLHRKKGNWWKAITLGTGPQRDFVGWSGLVNTLLVEELLGVQVDSSGNVHVQPQLPPEAKGLQFNLSLPQYGTQVILDASEVDNPRVSLIKNGHARS
jgi:hypothetical protein